MTEVRATRGGGAELARLTWQEAARHLAGRPVGLLPAGAIEAHGPHLPLDTDVIIAEEMARRAVRELKREGLPSLILPGLWYGVSFAGTSFPGTSPVTAEALRDYAGALLQHLAPQGYRAIAICNAHLEPAHVAALRAAVHWASGRTGVPIVVPDQREPRWAAGLSEEFRRGARHAGAYETSLVLAARPDAVRGDALARLEPVWVDLPARLRAGARTFAEAGGALGYFGDPRAATADEGERLFGALGRMIATSVVEQLNAAAPPNDMS